MNTPGPRVGPATDGARLPAAARRTLQAFYLATPAFALLDLALGVNLRTTFLDEGPALKLLYYGIAFACGLAVTRWPRRAGLIGLVESGTNIAWLVIGIMLRYLGAIDAALADDASAAPPFTGQDIANLLVSSAVLVVSYLAAQAQFAREPGGTGAP